jgi:tail protein
MAYGDGPYGDEIAEIIDDVGTITAIWIDPEGTEHPLSSIDPGLGWFTTFGIGGWGARPYEYVTDPLARGGDQVRFIHAQPARITWPLHVYGETHAGFVTRFRQLQRAFMLTVWKGQPGTLRVTRPDGTAREIDCFYEEGFKGEPGEMWLFANPVLTLLAPDGYWRDKAATTETRGYQAGTSFLGPFLTVSTAQVLGNTTINNPGDVTAWPEWTITGPASVVTATNHTTNQSFTLTHTLLASQTITVTTQTPTVRGPVGQNLVSALNWPAAYLWGLDPGVNVIDFTLADAGETSSVVLSYHPRYEGA